MQDDGDTASGGGDWADQILERARARSTGDPLPDEMPEPEEPVVVADEPDKVVPTPAEQAQPRGIGRRPTLATVENPNPEETHEEFLPFAEAYERAGSPATAGPFGDEPRLPPHLTIESSPAEETEIGIPGATASTARSVLEWVGVVIGALVVALLVKQFLFAAYYIPSPSMEPTLFDGDRIVVNKLSYRLHEVNRGDVVVFQRSVPLSDGINDLIKRVIALPGETVEVVDGRVYVDGGLLLEPYLLIDTDGEEADEDLLIDTDGEEADEEFIPTDGFPLPPGCIGTPDSINRCTVPDDHVFVMGDNRRNSRDSRIFGPVSEDDIVGRAFIRVWPLGDLGRL